MDVSENQINLILISSSLKIYFILYNKNIQWYHLP